MTKPMISTRDADDIIYWITETFWYVNHEDMDMKYWNDFMIEIWNLTSVRSR